MSYAFRPGRALPLLTVLAMLSACATPLKPVKELSQEQLESLSLGKVDVQVSAPGARETLAATLTTKLTATLPGCMDGSKPADVSVRVDNYKEQNGAMTILVGDNTTLAGKVQFKDPASQSVMGEYYIEEIRGGGGLLGVAMLADAENSLTGDFAKRICSDVFKQK